MERHRGTGTPLLDLELRQSYAIDPAQRALYAPDAHTVTISAFAAEAPAGWEPVLDREHDAYRWCTLDEAVATLHFSEMKMAMRVLGRALGLPA